MDLNHCRSHSNIELLTTNDGLDQDSNARKRKIELNEIHEGANDDELKVDFVLVYIGGEGEDEDNKRRECYEDNLESRGLILEDVSSEKVCISQTHLKHTDIQTHRHKPITQTDRHKDTWTHRHMDT